MTGARAAIAHSWTPEAAVRASLLIVPLIIPVVPDLWFDNWRHVVPAYNLLLQRILIAVFGLGILNVIGDKDRTKLVWLLGSPLVIFSTLYVLGGVSTAFFIPWREFVKTFPSLFIYGYLPVLIVPIILKSPREVLPAFLLMVVSAVGFSLQNDFLWLQNPGALTPLHVSGTIHKNLVADVSATGALILISFLMTRTRNSNLAVVLCVAAIIVCFASILGANGRACMLSLPIAAIAIGIAQRKRRGISKVVIAGGLSVALLVGGLLLAPKERVEELSRTEQGSSAAARPYFWKLSIDYLQQNPFSPSGFGRQIIFKDTNQILSNPCNFFLQQWIELGLWSAVAYTAMVLGGIALSYRALSRASIKNWSEFAFVAAVCLSVQLLRFLREVQDLCTIGYTYGMCLPDMIGITIFLTLLLKKAEQKSALSEG